jgi:putative redox protein
MADKTAKVVWKGDMTFDGFGSTFPDGKIVFDAEESVGGHDRGFRPLEMLLVGLAGCTAMDVISILKKKKQDVTGFEVAVEGIQAAEHPKYFTEMTVVYRVPGHDIDPAASSARSSCRRPGTAARRPCCARKQPSPTGSRSSRRRQDPHGAIAHAEAVEGGEGLSALAASCQFPP